MNFISIQTPNEPKDIWKVCQIIKLEVNQFKNNRSIHVKGIAKSNSVTTGPDAAINESVRRRFGKGV